MFAISILDGAPAGQKIVGKQLAICWGIAKLKLHEDPSIEPRHEAQYGFPSENNLWPLFREYALLDARNQRAIF